MAKISVDSFFKVPRSIPIGPNWKQRKKRFIFIPVSGLAGSLENFNVVPKDTLQNDFSCQ